MVMMVLVTCADAPSTASPGPLPPSPPPMEEGDDGGDAGRASEGGAPDSGPDASSDASSSPEAGTLDFSSLTETIVLADWSDRTVSVYEKEGKRLARFPATFGRKGVGKEERGDLRSPEGTYRLHRGRRSQYHRFLPVSYPGATDADRGLEKGRITKAQHGAILRADKRGRMTPQGTKLGGQVGVHGFGKGLTELEALFRKGPRRLEGTRGCIMILDEHIDQLERLVRPGVTLVIRQ